MKILIDQNVSARLARLLTGHNAIHASSMGWSELTNGDLLTAAEADAFEIFVTADKNIQYQQNLARRRIALVVLGTNHRAGSSARIGIERTDRMVGTRYVTGKAKTRTAAKKPALKKHAAAKPSSSAAGRFMAERRAAAALAVKIRRKSKSLAASADRLLSRI